MANVLVQLSFFRCGCITKPCLQPLCFYLHVNIVHSIVANPCTCYEQILSCFNIPYTVYIHTHLFAECDNDVWQHELFLMWYWLSTSWRKCSFYHSHAHALFLWCHNVKNICRWFGKIIRTILFCVVYNSCAQWYVHTYEQILQASVGLV